MSKKNRKSQPVKQEKEISLVEWAVQKVLPAECEGTAFPLVHRPWMQVIQ